MKGICLVPCVYIPCGFSPCHVKYILRILFHLQYRKCYLCQYVTIPMFGANVYTHMCNSEVSISHSVYWMWIMDLWFNGDDIIVNMSNVFEWYALYCNKEFESKILGNINIHLHFISFRNTEMAQIVGILSCARQRSTCPVINKRCWTHVGNFTQWWTFENVLWSVQQSVYMKHAWHASCGSFFS